MNKIKYFFQFIIIIIIFFIFKILGVKISSFLSGKLFELIGPVFRSKRIIDENIKRAFPDIDQKKIDKINSSMWKNYGRILAEYMYIKDFRNLKLKKFIEIENSNILEDINRKNKPVISIIIAKSSKLLK